MRLRVVHHYSRFWLILARFMDYYSQFWGPGVISTINEPRGAFSCRSSALVVFVDSDPFCELLLTIMGSQSDFHGCRTPRCAYVLVIKTHSLGRFWPVSWTITRSFRVPKRFPWLSNTKVRSCFGHQQSQFRSILPRFLDYYPILGSRSHFHD